MKKKNNEDITETKSYKTVATSILITLIGTFITLFYGILGSSIETKANSIVERKLGSFKQEQKERLDKRVDGLQKNLSDRLDRFERKVDTLTDILLRKNGNSDN